MLLWDQRFIKRCGTCLYPAQPRSTADFSQMLPHGNWDSFHTWCLASPLWSKQRRFVSKTDTTKMVQIWSVFFKIIIIIKNILLALRVSLSWSPRQQACYTEGSSGRANWLFIHVLNTMFCVVGRNHITAITFSSGSQYANRFCVYFSSLGKDPCCCLEID